MTRQHLWQLSFEIVTKITTSLIFIYILVIFETINTDTISYFWFYIRTKRKQVTILVFYNITKLQTKLRIYYSSANKTFENNRPPNRARSPTTCLKRTYYRIDSIGASGAPHVFARVKPSNFLPTFSASGHLSPPSPPSGPSSSTTNCVR